VSTNDKDRMVDRVIDTASRLRRIQADLANESCQTRQVHLSDELGNVLETILSTDREEFLRRLLGLFLSGDFAAQRETEGPEAGMSPGTGHDDSVHAGQELEKQLKVTGDLRLETKELVELTTMLVEFVSKLDPLIWNTWRALSPRSSIRRQGSLAKKIEQFLQKDDDVSGSVLGEDLKVLQRLIAALVTAVSRAGGQFARRHLARFSPAEIAALVRMESRGVFVSHEVKCWRKYVELAEDLNEDAIDVEIKKTIVDYVESLGKGMTR